MSDPNTDSENVSLIRCSVLDDPKTYSSKGIIDRYIKNITNNILHRVKGVPFQNFQKDPEIPERTKKYAIYTINIFLY